MGSTMIHVRCGNAVNTKELEETTRKKERALQHTVPTLIYIFLDGISVSFNLKH